jgi:hypothetical protein
VTVTYFNVLLHRESEEIHKDLNHDGRCLELELNPGPLAWETRVLTTQLVKLSNPTIHLISDSQYFFIDCQTYPIPVTQITQFHVETS